MSIKRRAVAMWAGGLVAVAVLFAAGAQAAELPATSPGEVEQAIESRISRVPEFEFIRAEAEKLGVRAYLFGGTAAAFAHYVRNDLLREQGDTSLQVARFDYDFTNIFRSTQDLDVVVDGTPEQIEKLATVLAAKFPHFVGGKAAKWELRSLRESKGVAGQAGYKEALLDSTDFLNQNSDSNSTGLIEVTKPKSGHDVVLDLRDPKGRPSQFLKDVSSGEITFYESSLHGETPRARAGNNPEIFSVIRALTKAFQYDLKIRAEDWAKMQAIVQAFDPATSKMTDNTKRRLIDMGKKLFMHAVDVERAWNDTEALGLRAKLLVFDSAQTQDSLAWWMSKEPLRSRPLGLGDGRTAAEIAKARGMDGLIVSHETRSFLALESIERSVKGVPNFFISRQATAGEAAAYGEGVYTRIGRRGAAGSGLTIRMRLDPRAREGSDFVLVSSDYIILRNKAAATVIDESFTLSPSEYVDMISRDVEFDSAEKGLIEKMTRRLRNQAANVSPEEQAKIREIYLASDNKTRILVELSRLGLPLPLSRSERDRRCDDLRSRIREGKRTYREGLVRRLHYAGTQKKVIEQSLELAVLARNFDDLRIAYEWGFRPDRTQLAQAYPYVIALRKVVSETFEHAWDVAVSEGREFELRPFIDEHHLLSEYKLRLLPRVETADELVEILERVPGQPPCSGCRQWFRDNPERVMELRLSEEDLEALFADIVDVYQVGAWADRALSHAKTVEEFIIVTDPKGGAEWQKTGIVSLDSVWTRHAAAFLKLKPTPEQIAYVVKRSRSDHVRRLLQGAAVHAHPATCTALFSAAAG